MDLAATIQNLADGQWHRVADTGVCQALLYDVGLTTQIAADGRCRLTRPIELLDAKRIRGALKHAHQVTVEVAGIVDSTNTRLLEAAAASQGNGRVMLAEYQSAGRGRVGRTWLCPYAGGLCLSVAWQFTPIPRQPGTLSLAVGVALKRALAQLGMDDTHLKWPNDLLHDRRKLGGILIDVTRSDDSMQIVAGVGLNLFLTVPDQATIGASGGLEPVALSEIAPDLAARRNTLAASIIDQMIAAFIEFQQNGFESFQQEYNHADVLLGRAVHVTGPENTLDGQAIGVDETGALLVRAGEVTHVLYSGDVRVRI